MARTADMFEKPPRARPRVMMHWDDAGHSGASPMGNFVCKGCGYRAGWLEASETEMRRGVPCPHCNVFTPTEVAQILCDNSPRCDEHCTHTSTQHEAKADK